MKRANVQSRCICGAQIEALIGKPTHHQPTIAKVTCECGTRYMLTCRKSGADQITVSPKVLELSDAAKEIAQKRITDRAGL